MSFWPICELCNKRVQKLESYYLNKRYKQCCIKCLEYASKKKTFSKDKPKDKSQYRGLYRKEFGTMAITHGASQEKRIPFLRFAWEGGKAEGSIIIFTVESPPESNVRDYGNGPIKGSKIKVKTGIFNDENFVDYFYLGSVFLTDEPFIRIIQNSSAKNPMTKQISYKGVYCVYVLEGILNDKGKFYSTYNGFRGDNINEVMEELDRLGIIDAMNSIWRDRGMEIPNKFGNDGYVFLTHPDTMSVIVDKITENIEFNKSLDKPKSYKNESKNNISVSSNNSNGNSFSYSPDDTETTEPKNNGEIPF